MSIQTIQGLTIRATTAIKQGIVAGFNYVVGVGTKKLTVSSTEPINPKEGDLWVEVND